MNLRIPGPTPLPPNVLESQTRQMTNHRRPKFGALLHEVTTQLQSSYATENDLLILPTSSAGPMEGAVVNFLSPGERVMAVTIGNFGERFNGIAKAYGMDVNKVEFEPGTAADPDEIARRLDADPAVTT